MRRTTISVAAAALALLGTTALAPSANAADPDVVVGGLVTPLSFAVDTNGTVYVAQNFIGVLTKSAPGQDPENIYTDPNHAEVGAVSVKAGVVTFATTGKNAASLMRIDDTGTHTIADLYAFESSQNPDQVNTYGIVGVTKSCKAQAPKKFKRLAKYHGRVDEHPYASTGGDGLTYVADAAGNDILSVTDAGTVSALAVLPPVRVPLNKSVRAEFKLPKCAHTGTFKAEPVPTDVETGPDGNLYVTSLPGAELAGFGGVFKVDPTTGAVTRLSGGLVTPTGIAISPTGTAYISMLFASTVLAVPYGGDAAPFAQVELPGDVEYANGSVYVAKTDLSNPGDGTVPPAGEILKFTP